MNPLYQTITPLTCLIASASCALALDEHITGADCYKELQLMPSKVKQYYLKSSKLQYISLKENIEYPPADIPSLLKRWEKLALALLDAAQQLPEPYKSTQVKITNIALELYRDQSEIDSIAPLYQIHDQMLEKQQAYIDTLPEKLRHTLNCMAYINESLMFWNTLESYKQNKHETLDPTQLCLWQINWMEEQSQLIFNAAKPPQFLLDWKMSWGELKEAMKSVRESNRLLVLCIPYEEIPYEESSGFFALRVAAAQCRHLALLGRGEEAAITHIFESVDISDCNSALRTEWKNFLERARAGQREDYLREESRSKEKRLIIYAINELTEIAIKNIPDLEKKLALFLEGFLKKTPNTGEWDAEKIHRESQRLYLLGIAQELDKMGKATSKRVKP